MQLIRVMAPELSMPPEAANAPVTEFRRKTQFLQTTVLAPPDLSPPPPAVASLTELEVNVQLVRTGDPVVTRMPPPWIAKLPVMIRLLSVGAPLLIHMPPPRSLEVGVPLACPPVIVTPSRTPESVTLASVVTTW